MKKSLIYFSALLAFGFAACDDKSDLGKMQVNEQEGIMVADGVTVNLTSPVSGDSFSIEDYMESGVIPVLTYSVDASIPANAHMDFVMDLASDANYSDAVSLDMVAVPGKENAFGVTARDWDDAYRSLLGKSPYAKDNYVRIAAYVTINEQHSRVGGPDTWFGTKDGVKKLVVTPVDLHINVEEAYYLVGTINNWGLDETAMKFSHSDKSQFDDPVFTLALDIPAEFETAGYWWKVVPQSAYESGDWSGVFGVETNGDSALKGMLIEGAEGSGCLKVAGQYLFTINMFDCTYEVTQSIPMLYTPGGGNGWSFDTGMLNTNDFANYFGFVHMNGGFKVTDRPTWGGLEWGAGESEGTLKIGGGDVPGPENGLYWMTVNIGALTYNFLKIESIGIVGSFPDNKWASDYVKLTPTDDILVWTADIEFTDANTEWKFRTNGDWNPNPDLGGAYDNLANGGDDLSAPGVGTYTVTLDLRTVPYSCSFVAK